MSNNIFPVITLYQPWATWIMRRWKLIETRTHNKFCKELLNKEVLIHAGLTTDDSDLTTKNPYLTRGQILYNPDEVVNGYILGSAYVYKTGILNKDHSKDALIDCENTERYGLFLDDIFNFTNPIKAKGEVGIWYYDMDNKCKVKKPRPFTNQIELL